MLFQLAEAGHHCGQWLARRAFPAYWDGTRKHWSAGTHGPSQHWWQIGNIINACCFCDPLNIKKFHCWTTPLIFSLWNSECCDPGGGTVHITCHCYMGNHWPWWSGHVECGSHYYSILFEFRCMTLFMLYFSTIWYINRWKGFIKGTTQGLRSAFYIGTLMIQ